MKKGKISKANKKEQIEQISESYSVKSLLLIILIIIVVFVAFYFITTLVVKPQKQNDTDNDTVTQIDSNKITLNHLLDRSEDEYYVLATKQSLYSDYNSKINYIEIYDKYISDYKLLENSLPVYIIDLDDALNKNYIGDELNISDQLDKLKLNDETLFKIEKGKIKNYYVGSKSITEALSSLWYYLKRVTMNSSFLVYKNLNLLY